jgi:hypothetical protein
MALFMDFHLGNLTLYIMNFGTIILIPKCREVLMIQQYRSICLLKVSFIFFTKVAMNRVIEVVKKSLIQHK